MKTEDLRKKKVVDLRKELQLLLKERFNLRIQRGLGEIPRPHSFKEVRRNIARIKTVLTEKIRETR